MKNILIHNGKFKVIEKPNNLACKAASNQIYYDILGTLDFIDAEKCIQIGKNELNIKLINFRQYLKTLAKRMKKKYHVAISYDEKDEVLYI